MASLSSSVIWPSSWLTRVAIGAVECTHGQLAADPAAGRPVAALAPVAAPAAVIMAQARAAALANAAVRWVRRGRCVRNHVSSRQVAVIRVTLLARTLRRNNSSVNNAIRASSDFYGFFISE